MSIENPFDNPLNTQPLPPNNFSAENKQSGWSTPIAFGNWFASVIFAVIVPLVLIAVYILLFDRPMFEDLKMGKETPTMVMVALIGTFGGQLLSLLTSWAIVTNLGKVSFKSALGLEWPKYFNVGYAIVLAIAMLGLTILIEYYLPHKETSLDKYIKMGLPVRLTLALLATFGAPIVEEIIYRGVLYTAIEKNTGKWAAISVVTFLFWGVHVAQYYNSVATLVAVFVLSFVLTYLRAWTGKLLPGIIVHFIFNGVQGLVIVFAPQKALSPDPATSPVQSAIMLGDSILKLLHWH